MFSLNKIDFNNVNVLFLIAFIFFEFVHSKSENNSFESFWEKIRCIENRQSCWEDHDRCSCDESINDNTSRILIEKLKMLIKVDVCLLISYTILTKLCTQEIFFINIIKHDSRKYEWKILSLMLFRICVKIFYKLLSCAYIELNAITTIKI